MYPITWLPRLPRRRAGSRSKASPIRSTRCCASGSPAARSSAARACTRRTSRASSASRARRSARPCAGSPPRGSSTCSPTAARGWRRRRTRSCAPATRPASWSSPARRASRPSAAWPSPMELMRAAIADEERAGRSPGKHFKANRGVPPGARRGDRQPPARPVHGARLDRADRRDPVRGRGSTPSGLQADHDAHARSPTRSRPATAGGPRSSPAATRAGDGAPVRPTEPARGPSVSRAGSCPRRSAGS